MDQQADALCATKRTFTGADDNLLQGTDWHGPGRPHDPRTMLLLHGGGQTQYSWQGTARVLAERGWRSVTLDQRGHGESAWVEGGDYTFDAYARDLVVVARQLKSETGAAPIVVGASLGGLSSLIAEATRPGSLSALVLVDITPHVKPDGVERILGFMAEKAEEGFETLQAAADAIAAYLPHRPRPRNLDGLAKNLRLHEDGRYRWHWDPRFLDSRRDPHEHTQDARTHIAELSRRIKVPVLLVRGRESELVGEEETQRFLELVPHASVTDVSGARHMVAGDRNDVFTDAVLTFLKCL